MVIRLEERQSLTPTDFEPPKQQPDANFILLHKAIKGAEQYQENQNNQTSKASPHYLNRFLKKFPLKNTIWPNQPSVFPLSAKDQRAGGWGCSLTTKEGMDAAFPHYVAGVLASVGGPFLHSTYSSPPRSMLTAGKLQACPAQPQLPKQAGATRKWLPTSWPWLPEHACPAALGKGAHFNNKAGSQDVQTSLHCIQPQYWAQPLLQH